MCALWSLLTVSPVIRSLQLRILQKDNMLLSTNYNKQNLVRSYHYVQATNNKGSENRE